MRECGGEGKDEAAAECAGEGERIVGFQTLGDIYTLEDIRARWTI